MFVTAIAGLVATGSMLAPPAAINVPLKLTKLEKKQNQYMGLSFYSLTQGTQYLRNIPVPKSLGITHSALMYLSEDPMAVVAAKDPKLNRFAKIWIDFNRNKKFEDRELATYTGKDTTYTGYDCYEFKGQPVGPKGKVYARVLASGTQMAGLMPTAAMEGTFSTTQGRISAVSVLDTDYDGFFGKSSRYGGDQLVLASGAPVMDSSLNQLLALDDGRFYTCSVSANGKTITFLRDETPLGTLAVSSGTLQSVQLNSPKGSFVPMLVNGEVKLPAMEYSLSYASVSVKNDQGKKFQVSYSGNVKTKIAVKAGEKTELVFGEDMKLTLTSSNAGNGKSFDISLADKNGFKVNGLYDMSNNNYQQPKEPELVIVGPDGVEVATEKFHYG